MSVLQLPFAPAPAHAGTWVALLLEATAKGTLLLIVIALAMKPLRRGAAAVRHWVWTLAAVAVIVLPALAVLLPVWPLPIFPDTALWSYAVAKVGSPSLPGPQPAARRAAPHAPPLVVREALPASALQQPPPLDPPWRARVLAIWLTGAALSLLWLGLGTSRARRIARGARRIPRGRTSALLRELAQRVGLQAPVRVLQSDDVSTPLTLGIFEPVIVLPSSADRWTEERLRIVLLHELAHVRRHDCLTQLIADAACALYWFHPAVWHSARRLRHERERACDDVVLRTGIRPSAYARHLLDLACLLRGRAPARAAPMAQRTNLEERVEAILDPQVLHQPPSRTAFAAAALLVAALVLPLAALDPWAPAVDTPALAQLQAAPSSALTSRTHTPADDASPFALPRP